MLNPLTIATLYVSQISGDDLWSGFFPTANEEKTGPLKTLDKALVKVAQMRRARFMQPVSIKIVDEEYTFSNTVAVSNEISSVTIEPLTKTLLSGGVRISGFKEDVFNGVKCFSAQVPMVKEASMNFTDFYVDGKRAQFTRYPEMGYLKPESVDDDSEYLHTHAKWFTASSDDLKKISSFRNFDDCFISYNHFWIDEHTPIESYDMAEGKIVFKYPSCFSISPNLPRAAMEYIIENTAEMFKNPNEWYLDRPSGTVYYIPRDASQTAESILAYAPVVEKFFEIRGEIDKKVENIHFRNLEFAYTKGDRGETEYASDVQSVFQAPGTIEFEFAHGCSVVDCDVRNFGLHGVAVENGCSSIKIRRNTFKDGGAGGIKINGAPYGEDAAKNTFGIEASDNYITECARRYFAACGILVMHSFDNEISHNEISYLYYTGISCGWIWTYDESSTYNNLIEKNYIHHLGSGVLSDMGGVYTLGRQPGTVVRGNVIHDVEGRHYGGWGLYPDEASSYIVFEDNICYNLGTNCFHMHYGCMNTVRNNIFAMSKEAPVRLSRSEMHVGTVFERNIIVADGTPVYHFGDDIQDYEGCVHTLASSNNIIFAGENNDVTFLQLGETCYSHSLDEVQRIFGVEINSVTANPVFEDFENYNFKLKENSPAFKLGFKPIDVTDVGVRK